MGLLIPLAAGIGAGAEELGREGFEVKRRGVRSKRRRKLLGEGKIAPNL
jgi:hypothetical protein